MSWKKIKAAKDRHRSEVRDRPIDEKMALLERLRDRNRSLAEARPRPESTRTSDASGRSAAFGVPDQWGSLGIWRQGTSAWILTSSSTHIQRVSRANRESDAETAIWSVTTFGS